MHTDHCQVHKRILKDQDILEMFTILEISLEIVFTVEKLIPMVEELELYYI